MFKAQIDWRGIRKYIHLSTENKDSGYELFDDGGNICNHIPAIITVACITPFTEKYKAHLGTEIKKGILGREKEVHNTMWADRLTNKTHLHVLAPLSDTHNSGSVSELKLLIVDVPFDAIKHLSVIADRTKSIIDLTAAGQSKASKAFQEKTGVFANTEESQIVLDIDQQSTSNLRHHKPQIV
jgi:hypothetical protein